MARAASSNKSSGREHRAEHAQPRDEARDEHRAAAVPVEESIELLEPRARQPEARPEALDQPAAVAAADEEAEVVAEHRAADRRHDHPRQRQPAEIRHRRAGQKRRLAGHRQARVLEEHTEKDHRIAISREEIDQPLWHDAIKN